MRNATAINILDNEINSAHKTGSQKQKEVTALRHMDVLDVELNQFLSRLALSREFDHRQLLLPGFHSDQQWKV